MMDNENFFCSFLRKKKKNPLVKFQISFRAGKDFVRLPKMDQCGGCLNGGDCFQGSCSCNPLVNEKKKKN